MSSVEAQRPRRFVLGLGSALPSRPLRFTNLARSAIMFLIVSAKGDRYAVAGLPLTRFTWYSKRMLQSSVGTPGSINWFRALQKIGNKRVKLIDIHWLKLSLVHA